MHLFSVFDRVQATALMVFFNGVAGIRIFGALHVSMDGSFSHLQLLTGFEFF